MLFAQKFSKLPVGQQNFHEARIAVLHIFLPKLTITHPVDGADWQIGTCSRIIGLIMFFVKFPPYTSHIFDMIFTTLPGFYFSYFFVL